MAYPEFHNPRVSSLPCERMASSLQIAEDFVSSERFKEAGGTIDGTVVFNRGATFNSGSDALIVNYAQTSGRTIYIKFSLDNDDDDIDRLMFTSYNTASFNGFLISVLNGSLIVEFYDSLGTVLTSKTVDGNFNDGEIHSVVIIQDGNDFGIQYDDSDLVLYSFSGTSPTANQFLFGYGFTGTIHKLRICDEVLSASSINEIISDDYFSFMDTALAVYRCDEVCDDTTGNLVWDKQPTLNDLTKGDGVSSSSFPTFENGTYFFDYLNDYLSNFIELTGDYTVTAVLREAYSRVPYIDQQNDSTLIEQLSTAGETYGYLHSLILYPSVLNDIQLACNKYQHLYYEPYGDSYGFYSRLITEETAIVSSILSSSLVNWANTSTTVSNNGAYVSETGATFPNANSSISIGYESSMQLSEGTIFIKGSLITPTSTTALVTRGVNYSFLTATSNSISFNSESITHDINGSSTIAVVFKDGYKARFFVDGSYIGDSTNPISITSSGTEDMYIGNISSNGYNSEHTIDHVLICNQTLSDEEIHNLHQFVLSYDVDTNGADTIQIQALLGADIAIQSELGADIAIQATKW